MDKTSRDLDTLISQTKNAFSWNDLFPQLASLPIDFQGADVLALVGHAISQKPSNN